MFTGRTMINPILNIIFDIISASPHLKVHELAEQLKVQKALPELDKDSHKDLFKINFLIMNGLYQLQNELFDSHHLVHISALDIYIERMQPDQDTINADNQNLPSHTDPLKSYYLDWNNYDTSKEEIEALLNGFWQRYLSCDKGAGCMQSREALIKKWQLPSAYDLPTLQKKWRRLALSCHPDRGGNNLEFNQIKLEYEQLKMAL
ncbi:DNA-J related domain-containing protein [Pseudoalteromonas luteoviolacea]|nr:DNA-J related domain-containing protein [Pseudoalteromonas luteoviolacea]